ncbi:hypothetical protein [Kitasatospora sp. MMS16-BH015]|uniref:hypothetical protein n=1 Tax=Kitasatospora sp. MMS16-BH015 TaxID=2018025 RepID=UPI001580233D|nr:hypothetical protein [Kitasatospora sp. MMS16-BH015]
MPSEPSARPTVTHQVTTVERGSFCTARCSCGWYAPARRSRDKARRDAEEHLAAPEGHS